MDSRDEVVLALTDDMDTGSPSGGPHSPSTKRVALIGHFAFRSSALIIYILCAWFTSSFILPFIFILVCLSLDFWIVKNISGRILVGLRWSSYTDDEGQVHWRYDARKPSPIDSVDVSGLSRRELAARIARQQLSRLFWLGLIGSPVLWFVFLLAAVFSLNLRWALVCAIALCMNLANVYGYLRCWMSNLDGSASSILTVIKSTATNKVFANLWPTSKTGAMNASGVGDTSSVGSGGGLPLIA
ncbi:unnamed protein product [Heterobilharzia americana]|nr:unnamed protein product [Heterobilharzia americana]CAH8608009.1 unnamed protein product [Heterobilharzia americana]